VAISWIYPTISDTSSSEAEPQTDEGEEEINAIMKVRNHPSFVPLSAYLQRIGIMSNVSR
jgi:hypothetical protein